MKGVMNSLLGSMKKTILAVFLLVGLAGFAAAQSLPSVTIVNNTGYTIYYLYLSSTASDSWGNDMLGSEVLRSGYQISVNLPYALNVVNRYDIKAVDSDGDSYFKWNVSVSANSRIEFTMADYSSSSSSSTSTPTPVQSLPSITIVNNTGYTIWYIYLSSTASSSWGNDMLGSSVLMNGNSYTVNLPYALNAVNRYDIKVVDSDGDSYTKWNVTVAANSRIVFTMADFDY